MFPILAIVVDNFFVYCQRQHIGALFAISVLRRQKSVAATVPRGSKPQQDGPGLRHIERIKGPGLRNAQHSPTALEHAGPQAFVLIAQHQHGGQAQGHGKSVHCSRAPPPPPQDYKGSLASGKNEVFDRNYPPPSSLN